MANIRIKDLTTTFTPTLYTAPTAISAAGNTALTFPTVASDDYIELDGTVNGSRKQLLPRPKPVFKVTVSAGSAAFTATLTLPSTNAVAGDEIEAVVAMPASFNPLVEIRNLTSGGTLLGSIVGNTVARTWKFTARFDGTNWFLNAFAIQRAASIDEVADKTNAHSSRGGLAFDGTTSARVSTTLTNQSIGTDNFSISVFLRVPTANPSATHGIFLLGSSATSINVGACFAAYISTNGTLRTDMTAGSASDVRHGDLTTFLSSYAGKVVHLVWVRSAATLTLYINGVAVTLTESTGGSGCLWSQSITSTYLGVGFIDTSAVAVGAFYCFTPYNLALSQADVTEIYELGGAVPERFKFGTQFRQWAGFSIGFGSSDGTTVGGTIVRCTATNQTATPNAGGSVNYLRIAGSGSSDMEYWTAANALGYYAAGTQFRIKGYARAGGIITSFINIVGVGSSSKAATSATVTGLTSSWAAFSGIVTTAAASTINQVRFALFPNGVASASDYLELDDIEMQPLGAVCHYDADADGIGYQLHDQSTNKLDATITTTGVSWTKPATRGYVRTPPGGITWAGTHEPKNIMGAASTQRMLPNNAVVTLATLKASVASTNGASLNSTNTAARWSAVAALSTTKSVRTLANQLPNGTADADCDILLDPDTVAYTGAIDAEVQYTLTAP